MRRNSLRGTPAIVSLVIALIVAQPISAQVVQTGMGMVDDAPLNGVSINNGGQITAIAGFSSGEYRGYIVDKGMVTDLGDFGGIYTIPIKINAKGMVVGYAYDQNGSVHGFVWYKGELTDIGDLPENGGGFVFPGDINSRGVVAGAALDSDGVYHAFVWDGTMHDLGTGGRDGAYAVGINNRGDVAGTSFDSVGTRAVLWDKDGELTDLGDLGGGRAYAVGINEEGDVFGAASNENNSFHAFVWSNGTMVDYPGVDDGHGHADVNPGFINNGGDFVGTVQVGSENHCMVWQNGSPVDIGTGGFGSCYVTGINNQGAVAGTVYSVSTGEFRAFLWMNGTMTILTEDFSASGALNDKGVVLGAVLNEDGAYQGVAWAVKG